MVRVPDTCWSGMRTINWPYSRPSELNGSRLYPSPNKRKWPIGADSGDVRPHSEFSTFAVTEAASPVDVDEVRDWLQEPQSVVSRTLAHMTPPSPLDLTQGFVDNALPPIPYEDALHRVQAYCTAVASGWATYDLCAVQGRLAGVFDTITPWSLLLADALAGQVQVRDISEFNLERRQELAQLLAAVPEDQDLNDLDDGGKAAVARVCKFGFAGVWGPKSTKLSALYRPRAVPVLDGYVALAFGFARAGFSQGLQPRWTRIERVIDAMAGALHKYSDTLATLRSDAYGLVPDLSLVPNLRLLDMIMWTSQDDRMTRPGKQADRWLNTDLVGRQPITLHDMAPVAADTGDVRVRDVPPNFPHYPPSSPEHVNFGETSTLVWVELDLEDLGVYELWKDNPWYDSVPWGEVMNVLRPLITVGAAMDGTVIDRLPPALPKLVVEGVCSLFMEPLGIDAEGHPIGGGHRMIAMKSQGLRHAYGMR
jgi:hypothetical protein